MHRRHPAAIVMEVDFNGPSEGLRLAMTQCVTAGEIALNVFRCLMLEMLRQSQVTRHEQVGALHGALGPPERGPKGKADCNE